MLDPPIVRLFGGVHVHGEVRDIRLPTGKPSYLLGVLALRAGATVEVPVLIDALWDEDPPESARPLVHTNVSALRRLLTATGGPQVRTVPGGYRVELGNDEVDVGRLLALRGDTEPLDDLEHAIAAAGDPLLAGLDSAYVTGWRTRVAAHRELLQDHVWARRIEAGDAALVAVGLRVAVQEDPLREDRVVLLARALGGLGRRDEALAVLDRFRIDLSEELGLDPGARLAALREELVSASTATAVELVGRASPPGDQRPGRRAAAAGLIVTAAALVGLLVWSPWSGPASAPTAGPIDEPALLIVDAGSGEVTDSWSVPVVPAEVAVDGSTAWVRSEVDRSVAVVDLSRDAGARVVGLPQAPAAMAAFQGEATVGLGFSGLVVRIEDLSLGAPYEAVPGAGGRLTLTADRSGVWVATIDGRIHPPGSLPTDLSVPGTPSRMAVADGLAWVLGSVGAELFRVDVASGAVTRAGLRGDPVDIVAGPADAWAVTTDDNRLWRASAETGAIVATRPLPGSPVGLALTDGQVWVAVGQPPALHGYDASTLDLIGAVELPRVPADVVAAGGQLVVLLR